MRYVPPQTVPELLQRSSTGRQLSKQLEDEFEAERDARHADLRKRKAAAIALFHKQKPGADAAVKAADDKEASARKLAEEALQDYIKARAVLDTVYGTMTGTVDPLDREMRTCCDPRIEDFIVELEALKSGCLGLYRVSADGKSDNAAAIQTRAIAIRNALDAAERLKIDPGVADAGSAIDQLRNSIPKA